MAALFIIKLTDFAKNAEICQQTYTGTKSKTAIIITVIYMKRIAI